MDTSNENLERFFEKGIMGIIRCERTENVIASVAALLEGGIDIIEISFVTPSAPLLIQQIQEKFGAKVLVGAGTVLDETSAIQAISAGADFLISPVTNVEMIRTAKRYGKMVLAGAYTPTEVLYAWENGSDAVKVFPSVPAGPSYLAALHAPLPQIPLVPTGGVSLENLREFMSVGAKAVAAGSSLVNRKMIEDGEFEEISRHAQAWVSLMRSIKNDK